MFDWSNYGYREKLPVISEAQAEEWASLLRRNHDLTNVRVHWSINNTRLNSMGEIECDHDYWVGCVFMGKGIVIRSHEAAANFAAAKESVK